MTEELATQTPLAHAGIVCWPFLAHHDGHHHRMILVIMVLGDMYQCFILEVM